MIDIVKVIGKHVDLRQMGSEHRGRCPFHGGRGRPFAVIPKKGIYYCYVCHEGGDASEFRMSMLESEIGALRVSVEILSELLAALRPDAGVGP